MVSGVSFAPDEPRVRDMAEGITNGASATAFFAETICTRARIVHYCTVGLPITVIPLILIHGQRSMNRSSKNVQ